MTNIAPQPSDTKPADEFSKRSPDDLGRLVHVALDRALRIQDTMVQKNIGRARQRDSDATPAEVIRNLERMYLSALARRGATLGAVAAAPRVGTSAVAALTGGEVLSTLELTTLFALSLAEVHGVPMYELERRRTLVMGIMLGGSGSSFIPKVAGRTGKYWGRGFVARVPASALKPINRMLGENFVTKNGAKEGIVVLGRIAPFVFGAVIGGGANAVLAMSAIRTARRAFGPAPNEWEVERLSPPPAVPAFGPAPNEWEVERLSPPPAVPAFG